MSRTRRRFTAEFKSKVVIEMLEEGKSVNEIASKYDLLPKSVTEWKKQFMQNAALAFDKSSVVKEYKEEITKLSKEKDKIAKKLGEVIVERDWLEGKLKSLDLSTKKELTNSDSEVQAQNGNIKLSLNRRLKLLGISKTAYYYTPIMQFSKPKEKVLLNTIDEIHAEFPYYGTRRIVEVLKQKGFNVGRKLVKSAFKFLNISALYPKSKNTTIANNNWSK